VADPCQIERWVEMARKNPDEKLRLLDSSALLMVEGRSAEAADTLICWPSSKIMAFHHEGKSAASRSPRPRGLQDPVFLAAGAGYPGIEFGAVLPEVQMPPLLLHRVVNRAELSTLRASELAARLEIQPELQLSPTNIHLALDHFPSTSQTQRFAEKNIGIHSPESALPIWRAPALPVLADGPSSRVPPNACRGERCRAWGRTARIKSVPSTH
jgi:hypothetical protein